MIKNFYFEKISELENHNIMNSQSELNLMIRKCVKKRKFFLINDLSLKDINLKKFNHYFSKRIVGEPLSKIFNDKEFWSLNFYVNKNVLDPRPETEFIIEKIINKYPKKEKKFDICDLGTGSGCIIISLLKYYINASGVGVDISKKAIDIAKKNSIKHKVNKRLKLICKDWNLINKKFDIITANPPYISEEQYKKLSQEVYNYDPKISLYGGKNGYEKIREVIKIASLCMKSKSLFLIEIGYGQKDKVKKIANKNKLQVIEVIKDFMKIDRVVVLEKMA